MIYNTAMLRELSEYIGVSGGEHCIRDFIKQHINEDVDEIISNSSKGWKINRLSKVDLNILRLAIYEIKYNESIPVNVSINEAINLAKKYSSDEAPAFINGVLGHVVL